MEARREAEVLEQVVKGEMNLKEAAQALGYSMRTAFRHIKRYRRAGETGLVHGLSGRPSNRSKPKEIRERAVSLFGQKGEGVSISSFVQILRDEEGIKVSRESMRQWLIDAGLWEACRRIMRDNNDVPQA